MEGSNYITSTTFSILSNDEVSMQASIDISSELMTTTFKRNILNHSSFGPDPLSNQVCIICGLKYKQCNGHFGQFSNVRLFRSLFVPQILKVLKKVCIKCKSFRGQRSTECPICSTPRTDYSLQKQVKMYKSNKVDSFVIERDVGFGKKQIVPREQVYEILAGVSPSTLSRLGVKIQDGTDLMWTSFPIVPKMYRKDNKIGDKIMKSHVESLYQQMARFMSDRMSNLTKQDKITRIDNSMQVCEMQLVDGEKYRRSDGSANNTFIPRLVRKEGIIINDLICKRVNNCLRAVIVPASENISITEIGIPKLFAQDLIVHEHVTKFNIHRLNDMLHNKDYPQIKYRREYLENGEEIYRSVIHIDKLHVGDLIGRTLIDGDEVLVNRSPSLSKSSILCFKARITNGDKALALHLATTAGFGADFDGDEMSLFVLKHSNTRVECFMKMSSSENVFSSGFSGVLIALVQDLVAALRILTTSIFYVPDHVMKFLVTGLKTTRICKPSLYFDGTDFLTPEEAELSGNMSSLIEVYSGRSIFSVILPQVFNYESFDDNDRIRVRIVNGEFIEGEIDKYSVMKMHKGLINAMFDLYGEQLMVDFIDNMHLLSARMLKVYGLTTGLHDFYFSREQMNQMNTIKNIKFRTLYSNISRYERVTPAIDSAISAELNVIQNNNDVLSSIIDREFHMFHDIVTCGAKGSTGDMNKMSYCVGQTFIGAKRYIDRSPCIAKYDNSSRYAMGVIENGYMQGLSTIDIQMSNQNAINSEIIKHLSVARPGYMNTRVNETGRDNILMADFTVRTPLGIILIPHFFNSFDTERESLFIFKVQLDELTLNSREEYGNLDDAYVRKYNAYITRIYKFMDKANSRLNKYEVVSRMGVYLPFDFELLALNMKDESSEGNSSKPNKSIKYIIDKIDYILTHYNTSPFAELDSINKIPMAFALYCYTHPKRTSLSQKTLDKMFEYILDRIIFSQMDAGSAIMVKCGTSYMAVVSQELLKSIHSSQSKTAEKSLEDNLSVVKTLSYETIRSYVEGDDYNYTRLTVNELLADLMCIYDLDNNKRKYKIIYSDSDDANKKVGILFKLKLNMAAMIANKILLPYVFVNIIDGISALYASQSTLSKTISYMHVSSSALAEVPSINIMIDGIIPNVRMFIVYFVKLLKSINIRESNVKSIIVAEREFKYKQCTLEGVRYKDALQLPFLKQDFILTSHLYSVYLQYGTFGYLMASLINLHLIARDNKVNPKHGASLSCMICFNNTLVSLGRIGFDKISVGKWSNIAFESQSKFLIKAAASNIKDAGLAINSQLIYGHKLKLGTNHSRISYNLDKMKCDSRYNIVVNTDNSLYNIIKASSGSSNQPDSQSNENQQTQLNDDN